MQKLNETYFKLKKILGSHTESLESVQLVESYRRYFKPEKVRVILLAESHVFTPDDDRQIIIPQLTDLPECPAQYARFVYCLGYGEKTLTTSQLHLKRGATPPFWKIFFSCNNPISSLHDFSPILGQTKPPQRIINKIKLLKDLKAKGIWLVDASIVALYKEGKKIPNMFSALEMSWQSYTRDVVISANPEHVICIGKGVASIVEKDLRRHFNNKYTVLYQPNAHLLSDFHKANYEAYSKICFHSIFENPTIPLQTDTRSTSDFSQRSPLNKCKDTSKYRFDGHELGKSPLVLAVIRKHAAMNPSLDFNCLLEAFPIKIQGSFGVFNSEHNANEIKESTGYKRYFINPSELISLSDGKIAVCNQWNPKNIARFIRHAKDLGYQIDDSQ